MLGIAVDTGSGLPAVEGNIGGVIGNREVQIFHVLFQP